MKILHRHLVAEVLRGVMLVVAILLAINTVIAMVGQLDDVGGGTYGFFQAVSYVALGIPGSIVEMLPAAALIGSLLALGNLAVHRELVVMRSNGFSHMQLAGALTVAGLILVLVMVLLGESLAPRLGAYAREMRTRALHTDVDLEGGGVSTWLKSGDRILSFHRQQDALAFDGGVLIFELGSGQSLDTIAHADSADVGLANDWLLSNYVETKFTDSQIKTGHERRVRKDYNLSPDLLGLAVVREDLLSTSGLERYISYLRANSLDATRYLIAYWLRASNAVSVLFMTILALPFVFGSLRSTGTAGRLLVGLVIGLTYYVAAQMLAHSGEVFHIDPRIVGWAPTGLLVLVTLAALSRLRGPG